VSTIWRAIHRKYGWVVHFANHRDLNAFLFDVGASSYEVESLAYSKKQDIIKMLNDSATQGWMNGRNPNRKIKDKEEDT